MNDGAADRALFGKGANLGHEIVANLALNFRSPANVDIPDVVAQIGDLFGGHQPGFVLGFGQRHPKRRSRRRLSASLQRLRISSLP